MGIFGILSLVFVLHNCEVPVHNMSTYVSHVMDTVTTSIYLARQLVTMYHFHKNNYLKTSYIFFKNMLPKSP